MICMPDARFIDKELSLLVLFSLRTRLPSYRNPKALNDPTCKVVIL